jgi:ATP-dependent Clp protease adaptor protein ClpS
MGRYDAEIEETIQSDTREHTREPSMYKVLLHNDDYTTMEFVVEILIYVFNRTIEDATMIMLNVHKQGVGICGVYTYEIAETKVETVHRLAREKDFPLKCSMEKE